MPATPSFLFRKGIPMLKTKQSITIDAESIINGVKIATFRAVINSENPNDMNHTTLIHDKLLYKENRVAVRADSAEFEDYAYSVQDNMLAEMNNEESADAE